MVFCCFLHILDTVTLSEIYTCFPSLQHVVFREGQRDFLSIKFNVSFSLVVNFLFNSEKAFSITFFKVTLKVLFTHYVVVPGLSCSTWGLDLPCSMQGSLVGP